VPDSTLAAVLEALLASGGAIPPGPPQRTGAYAAPVPPREGIVPPRQYGFTVQLYSLRSRDSWGHGDLRDLADFAGWAARDLGADFVLINPVHAAEPVSPITASPYTPVSRRFLSPLYLASRTYRNFHSLNDAWPVPRTRHSSIATRCGAPSGRRSSWSTWSR